MYLNRDLLVLGNICDKKNYLFKQYCWIIKVYVLFVILIFFVNKLFDYNSVL